MNRLTSLSIAFAAVSTSACNDVVVDAIAATGVRRQPIPEYESLPQEADVIELVIEKNDFERHIRGRWFFLFASDCKSYEPGIDIGSSIGQGRLDPGLGGYRLRFILDPLPDNAYYAQNWSERLKCVYMKTEADYDPTTYRSNVVRIGTAK